MKRGISLYIHIPFCKKKCLYCDFPSYSGKEKLMGEYMWALSHEIEKLKGLKISTIFIGGGTPTYLSIEEFQILKDSVEKLNLAKNLEFTVECNPGTADIQKLKFLRKIGVNRLSIGLQAWQDELLKGVGRIHNIEEFLECFYDARKAGFNNINVDLMFGIPDQNLNQWQETLKSVIKLNPEHVSCYSLIIEKGTPFYTLYTQNKLNLPKEDDERKMYELAGRLLNEAGYNQYEISNFSKHGKKCRHNLCYWELHDYIGCGSSAHSYYRGQRYRNEVSIEKYIDDIKNKNSPVCERHINTVKDDMEEYMFLGLRKTNGIYIPSFEKRFKVDINDIYGTVIRKYKKYGFIIENNGCIFLPHKAISVSNSILSDFIL